jgi:hypothetical protein
MHTVEIQYGEEQYEGIRWMRGCQAEVERGEREKHHEEDIRSLEIQKRRGWVVLPSAETVKKG